MVYLVRTKAILRRTPSCVDYSLSLRQSISPEGRLTLTYSSENSVQIQAIDVVWLIPLLVYQEAEGPS